MSQAEVGAQRDAFGEAITGIGAVDERVLILDGDVGNSTGAAAFESAFPDRYIQLGIAEQNLVGMAAGLATLGYVPVVSAFACFAVARALDSIRVLVAQPGLNVKIIGAYAGLMTGKTGKTHQILNDLAIMRSLSHVSVYAPADVHELKAVLHTVVDAPGPAYVQVVRDPTPVIFAPDHEFEVGKAIELHAGTDVTVMSTGVQSARVLEAARMLEGRGLSVQVLHLCCLSPLDVDAVTEAARSTGLVITVEEQDTRGGLGGAVAETLGERCPTHLHRLGIDGRYGASGTNEDLLEEYGLSAARVADDVERIVRRHQASV